MTVRKESKDGGTGAASGWPPEKVGGDKIIEKILLKITVIFKV